MYGNLDEMCSVHMQVATQIVASLLALETLSDSEDIKLYINSPGAYFRGQCITHLLSSLHAHDACTILTGCDVNVLPSYQAGGQAYSVIAILDTIEAIKPDVVTIALGQCASTATLLLVRHSAVRMRPHFSG